MENNRRTLSESRDARPGLPCVALAKKGFTLVEAMVAIATASIVMLSVALLVQSGYRSWLKTYNNANCDSRIDSLDSMIALGSTGRKSNKTDYCLYRVEGGTFTKPVPVASPDEILTGQAIEFHYWNTDLDASLLDPANHGNTYSLFYLDGTQLKVDKGSYPPGGINGSGHRVAGGDVGTLTLARNVTSVTFTHTAKNMTGDGKGCIRMRLVITDPDSGETKTTLAATMMRNVWP
jgi:type II secretory pathway pseudopilin PulG